MTASNMAFQLTRRPSLRSGHSLGSFGSPPNAYPLGRLSRFAAASILCVIAGRSFVQACSRVGDVEPALTVRNAEVIVVASAADYLRQPDSKTRRTGRAESVIRFEVLEIIKGPPDFPQAFTLNGYLSDRDDFNDHPAPYRFVRPEGRGGTCYANDYKQGALFLLLLKTRGDGYTVDWDPLAPVNEQLHSLKDPWIAWVQDRVSSDRLKK